MDMYICRAGQGQGRKGAQSGMFLGLDNPRDVRDEGSQHDRCWILKGLYYYKIAA